jgi:flagellar motor switch protein FliN/FliY
MDDTAQLGSLRDGHAFRKVPIEVRVSVGRAWPRIEELLQLAPDAVISLDKSVDDPVDLYIGDRLIARGYLEEIEDDPARRIAVRLTEVARDGENL